MSRREGPGVPAAVEPSPINTPGQATAGDPRPPAAPADCALDQVIDLGSLYSMRAAVAAHAAAFGLAEPRLSRLLLAVSELATNTIRHGGGTGRLRLWHDGTSLYCQISDTGPGINDPDAAGTTPVPVQSDGGRGLWLIRQLCDQLHLDSTPAGTTATIIVIIA